MKKTYCILLTSILVMLVFCGCSITENGNNSGADTKDINNRLVYNKISNSVNKEYLQDVLGDDFETQYESVVLPEDAEKIKNSLIEDTVICKVCEEKGIRVDRNAAEQKAKAEYENLKIDSSQMRYYSILENVLSENKLSETEYLDLLYDQSYFKYNKQALKEFFYKNIYKEGNDESLDEQFNEYIKSLI